MSPVRLRSAPLAGAAVSVYPWAFWPHRQSRCWLCGVSECRYRN